VRFKVFTGLKICVVVCWYQCFISMPYLHRRFYPEDAGNKLQDCGVMFLHRNMTIQGCENLKTKIIETH
jgi:hypothetical protein